MTLQRAKKNKAELEEKLTELIREFESQNCLHIHDVILCSQQLIRGREKVIDVKVKIQI